MKIYDGTKIDEGYLDFFLNDHEVRIKVGNTFILKKIDDQYIIPARSLRLIFNYVKKIGVREVIRKVNSRLKESSRNDKYVIFGEGEIMDSKSTRFDKKQKVYFIGYNHPRWADNVVINEDFVKADDSIFLNPSEIRVSELSSLTEHAAIKKVSSWSPFSGKKIAINIIGDLFDDCISSLEKAKEIFSFKPQSQFDSVNWHSNSEPVKAKNSTVLFGLGQYAKTMVVANLHPEFGLSEVCEIDPLQLRNDFDKKILYSTNPLKAQKEHDIYIVAGFHHTHAPIALDALKKGCYAMVEKPLVTTIEQYNNLKEYFDSGKIFVGFHKRYMKINDYVYDDLAVKKGDPISYFCIVYEIDLPEKHWYNWPNSQSRIVSNGCHWIDHFMFLNDYSSVRKKELIISQTGDYLVMLELENGAVFHLTLTDKGSSRLGVREHIEIRSKHNTIRITDSRYVSESGDRILRDIKFGPYNPHKRMYKIISSKIINKESGDKVESFKSTKVMLELEQIYEQLTQSKQKPVLQ